MIKIDYFAGMHGRFLEYVVNVFILKTVPSNIDILTELGTAHNASDCYHKNKIVHSHPYSAWNCVFDSTDSVIRISTNQVDDDLFFKILTNAVIRVDDRGLIDSNGFNGYTSKINPDMIKSQQRHRNFWYDRLLNRSLYQSIDGFYNPQIFQAATTDLFEFEYQSFFSLPSFFKEMNRLAFWLDQRFYPTEELCCLWRRWIDGNQGVMSYNKCSTILESIFSNKDSVIDCTILEEAWLNFNLSKISRLYEGLMFDKDQYPTNTKHIHNLLTF